MNQDRNCMPSSIDEFDGKILKVRIADEITRAIEEIKSSMISTSHVELSGLSNSDCLSLLESLGAFEATSRCRNDFCGKDLVHFAHEDDLNYIGLSYLPPFKLKRILDQLASIQSVGAVDVDNIRRKACEAQQETLQRENVLLRQRLTENRIEAPDQSHQRENIFVPKKLIETQESISFSNAFDCTTSDLITKTSRPYLFTNVSLPSAALLWMTDKEKALTFYGHISHWNTVCVTNMSYVFGSVYMNGPFVDFNEDISKWDVSHVTILDGIFLGATSFNQNLNFWKVDNVRSMNYAFCDAKSFNQPLNLWNTSSVTSMLGLFSGALSFNQPLENWNVSQVENMSEMFYEAKSFNQWLGDWDIGSVIDFNKMFLDAISFDQNNSPFCDFTKKKEKKMKTLIN